MSQAPSSGGGACGVGRAAGSGGGGAGDCGGVGDAGAGTTNCSSIDTMQSMIIVGLMRPTKPAAQQKLCNDHKALMIATQQILCNDHDANRYVYTVEPIFPVV